MPKITVSKEQMEGRKPLSTGIYEVVLRGFEPKKSKDGGSINLRPKLVVVNHATENNNRVFDNLNSNAGFYHEDFVHAFGLQMEQTGPNEFSIPGDFMPDPNDPDNPTKWVYNGPLLGRTARVEVVLGKNTEGKDSTQVKRWLCAIPGCQNKHKESLIKA